jgi:uncharacterized membrane protein
MEENFTVDPKDAQDNKIMGILAYLNILVLVPIFAAKESPFARFHANQGLILLIASIALYVVVAILAAIFLAVSYALAALISILYLLVWLGILVFIILGIINAAKGEMKELPIIGKYRIIK